MSFSILSRRRRLRLRGFPRPGRPLPPACGVPSLSGLSRSLPVGLQGSFFSLSFSFCSLTGVSDSLCPLLLSQSLSQPQSSLQSFWLFLSLGLGFLLLISTLLCGAPSPLAIGSGTWSSARRLQGCCVEQWMVTPGWGYPLYTHPLEEAGPWNAWLGAQWLQNYCFANNPVPGCEGLCESDLEMFI